MFPLFFSLEKFAKILLHPSVIPLVKNIYKENLSSFQVCMIPYDSELVEFFCSICFAKDTTEIGGTTKMKGSGSRGGPAWSHR